MAGDSRTARAQLAAAVAAVVAVVAESEGMAPLDAASAVGSAAAVLLRAVGVLSEAGLFESELQPVEIDDPGPDVAAGVRLRALRQSLRLNRDQLAYMADIGESTIRALEGGRPFRRRVVVCLAAGLAVVAHPGQLDPDILGEELCAAMARDGLLSPAREFDDDWAERRLRRIRARDGAAFRAHMARLRIADSRLAEAVRCR